MLDTSDKTALAIAVIGAVTAALGVVSTALSGGGFTALVGVNALIAGLVYFMSHQTQAPA